MKIESHSLILNEYEVVEEMVRTGIIPDFYNNTGILVNRLFRYFYELDSDNAVDLLKQELDRLDILYEDEFLENGVMKYEVVQPLKRTNGINIYQSEVDSINKIKGRTAQRTAFSLLIIQKVLSPHSNKLYFDNWCDMFKPVNITNQVERNNAIYELQQQGVVDVPLFDNYLEVKIAKTDGKINTTIKDGFDKADKWFDKIFAENTNLETVIMVDEDGNIREFRHTGYSGVAKILSQEGRKITKGAINQICKLQREQLNGAFFFVLDEEWCKQGDYELRKSNYIKAMKQAREILIRAKRNPNKKLKLYVRIDGGDGEILTKRIK